MFEFIKVMLFSMRLNSKFCIENMVHLFVLYLAFSLENGIEIPWNFSHQMPLLFRFEMFKKQNSFHDTYLFLNKTKEFGGY